MYKYQKKNPAASHNGAAAAYVNNKAAKQSLLFRVFPDGRRSYIVDGAEIPEHVIENKYPTTGIIDRSTKERVDPRQKLIYQKHKPCR